MLTGEQQFVAVLAHPAVGPRAGRAAGARGRWRGPPLRRRAVPARATTATACSSAVNDDDLARRSTDALLTSSGLTWRYMSRFRRLAPGAARPVRVRRSAPGGASTEGNRGATDGGGVEALGGLARRGARRRRHDGRRRARSPAHTPRRPDEGNNKKLRDKLEAAAKGHIEAQASWTSRKQAPARLQRSRCSSSTSGSRRSQVQVGAVAAESYRFGRLTAVTTLLNSATPEDFLERAASLDLMAQRDGTAPARPHRARSRQSQRAKAAVDAEVREAAASRSR